LESLVPGGWPEIMERNRRLALAAQKMFCISYNQKLPAPESMIGSMVSIPLPDAAGPQPKPTRTQTTPWQDLLLARCEIEVPIVSWPAYPKRLVRVSAQLYNHKAQYDLLAEGIRELLDDQM
ncbi:MAG: hypothetical protein KJT03_23280, partial [Verrucomicrobiae bacterium]|nr:hypothetical protein [Verrucomicrobiae bacterium]